MLTDKSTSLLLCQPPYQVTAKQSINEHSENELRKKRAQLFDPMKDFRKYQSKAIATQQENLRNNEKRNH